MDKYEFNIKVEQIKKMVNKGDYETAMKIADTIDWRRVRNVSILSMVATIYEKNEEYQEAKDILLLAFERAPIGKRLLYKLAELAIREGSIGEAEDYYREFCDLAPDDPRQYLLRYMILGAKGAPPQQLIHTLEQYCNVELDEKWLYELATLYDEVGMADLCVRTCDKIMLMFGLGKYVDKAMELKLHHAPLTKYQMDLEENRDKYEARLRAVEQGYEAPAPLDYDAPQAGGPAPVIGRMPVQPEDPSAAYEEEPVYGERQPYRPYRRPQETEEPVQAYETEHGYGEAEDAYYGQGEPQAYGEDEGGYQEPVYGEPGYETDSEYYEGQDGREYEPYGEEQEELSYAREPVDSAYIEEDSEGAPYAGDDQEYEAYEGGDDYGYAPEPEDGEYEPEAESYDGGEPEEEPEKEWPREEPLTQEALAARVHEAEVQANLARELSRLSGAEFSEESRQAQTRVLKDLRSLKAADGVDDMVPARVSNHLMIEAEDPDAGLALAIEALKQIHRELGIKNQAAKITGEKLNKKGVLALADKLTGKDLIIEYAGDMSDEMLLELDQLMARDETGMNVVLIDNREQLEAIHRQYPGLAKRFECIGESVETPAQREEAPAAGRPAPTSHEETAEEPEDEPEEETPAPAPVPRPVAVKPQTEPKKPSAAAAGAGRYAQAPLKRPEDAPVRPRVIQPEPVREEPEPEQDLYEPEEYAEPEQEEVAPPPAPARIPVRPLPQKAPAAYVGDDTEDEEVDDDEEMDIDEFAQYACQYAGEIDCSISGKSMLALYERIEIMEEDGIPLTRANAEELIEEAADKAEKPSLGKRMKNIFSSKYDKDGLLILKEEHFI